MKYKFLFIVSVLSLGLAFLRPSALYAGVNSTVEILTLADAYVDSNQPNSLVPLGHPPSSSAGADTGRLFARTYLGAGADSRFQLAYLRFDLSIISAPVAGAEISLTRNTFRLWDEGDVEVFGLRNMEGNTSQDWLETDLTFNSTGSELIKPLPEDQEPLDFNRLEYLGTLPAASDDDPETRFASENLDSFINEMVATQAYATIVLYSRYNENVNIILNSSRASEGQPNLRVPVSKNVEQVSLEADADTWVRIDKTVGEPRDEIIADMVYGNSENLLIRSRDEGGNQGNLVRERVAYIRFDLSDIEGVIGGGNEFFIVSDGSTGFSTSQVKLYGLVEGSGFTPQDWDEMALNWNTLGSELNQDMLGGFTSANDIRLDLPFFRNAPASADIALPNGLVPISFKGGQIDAFIRERHADNGLVTFVLALRPNADREISFFSREFPAASVRPQLRLNVLEGSVYDEPDPDEWAGLLIGDDGFVETGSSLGRLNVTDAPWVWSEKFERYLYVKENFVTESGIWSYAFQIASGDWFSDSGSLSFEVDTGDFLGRVLTSHFPWLYAKDQQAFLFLSSETYETGIGAWVFFPNEG